MDKRKLCPCWITLIRNSVLYFVCWDGNIHTRWRDVHQNAHYFVWQPVTVMFLVFFSFQLQYTHKYESNHHFRRHNKWCESWSIVGLYLSVISCLHSNELVMHGEMYERAVEWKCAISCTCTVLLLMRRQDRLPRSSSRFFMQADIQAATAAEKPVNNAGLVKNLSYREKNSHPWLHTPRRV